MRLKDVERFDVNGFQVPSGHGPEYTEGYLKGVVDFENKLDSVPVVAAIPIEWLNNKEHQADLDVYYCKGDSKKNVEIAYSIRLIKDLWEKEMDHE